MWKPGIHVASNTHAFISYLGEVLVTVFRQASFSLPYDLCPGGSDICMEKSGRVYVDLI